MKHAMVVSITERERERERECARESDTLDLKIVFIFSLIKSKGSIRTASAVTCLSACYQEGVAGSNTSAWGRSPVVLEVHLRSQALFKMQIQIETVPCYLHYLDFGTI